MSSEMLSAALDGECSAEELDQLLQQMERSPELKEQWSRLCLARDALSGDRVAPAKAICTDVMRAIGQASPSTKVVAFAPKRRAAAWRPLIGLATAAGVASVAFFLGYHSPKVQPVGAVTAQAHPEAVATTVAARTPAQPAKVVAVSQSGWESVDQEADARQLNNYLMDYSSYRSGAGMADTLGYARFAAHTAEYNPEH